ncbi:MAG TPA: phage minor head protein [Nitrospiraceae bacterium]
MADRPPRWKKLFLIADAAVGDLADQWQAWFRGLQRRLRSTDFTEVLAAPNTLAASALISQVVQHTLETPVRQELPPTATRIVEDAGQATVEHIRPTVQDPPYVTGLPETALWVEQHVGVLIRDVSQTTMLTVRQTLQDGWREGLHPRVLARQLRGMTGLTPRQAGAIEKQAAKWAAEGMRAAPLQKAVRQLQERAIRQRAETIARTETLAYSNYGAHSAVQQYVRRGVIAEADLVRQWGYTSDSKCCDDCASIPGMNPNGVGLNEEFHTPFGPLLLPPAHPNCRCYISTMPRGTL